VAAGGDQQRAYPWSAPPNALAVDCTYANYAPGGVGCSGGAGTVLRVGSDSPKGDGRWGHADLGGNAWEWVLDTWGTYANPCTDCARLGAGTQHTMCGGDFHDVQASMRTGNRFMEPSTFRGTPGIRCARAP
jgi:formylglycine-generating enzyme required for sulfatase activity